MTALPDTVGRYEVIGLLATGGMAEILLGKLVGPSGFERPLVLKRILPHLARQENFRKMFLDEARIVAGIRHPNVVDVHELCADDDELFLVMEYLEGESCEALSRRLRTRKQKLPHALAAYIISEACAGLHAAHELTGPTGSPLNLVHRDVSPGNVFITYDGRVKVIDFGVAVAEDRLAAKTETGLLKGKFSYMSPEQCIGDEIDRRADIFALGVVLYEVSCGRRLFKRSNELLTFQAIVNDPIRMPSEVVSDYPEPLEAVIRRALSRSRKKRYPTAAEMRQDLVRSMSELPLDEPPSDALAALMRSLFAERMEEKAEMIRRVASGSNITNFPTVDIETDSGLPSVLSEEDHPETWDSPSVTSSPVASSRHPAPPHTKRPAGWTWAAGATAFAAGVAYLFTIRPDPPPPAPAATQTAPTQAPAPPPPPTATASEKPTAPANITVDVITTPIGATVRIDGEDEGTTPMKLSLPRGDEPITLSFELAGHQTLEEKVTPNVHQRLQLVLRPAALARPPAGAPPQPEKKPPPEPDKGFRRFD